MTKDGADRERQQEANRILERISHEAGGGSSIFSRTARAVRRHVAASDVETDDRLVRLGTRIGRLLGLVLMAGLIVYLIFALTGARDHG